MPEMICIECLSSVTSANETKRKIIDADKNLREKIESYSVVPQCSSLTIDLLEIASSESQSTEIIQKSSICQRRSSRQRLQTTLTEASLAIPKPSKGSKLTFSLTEHKTDLKLSKTGKEFFCDICEFVSKRKKNLERHLNSVHMKISKSICSFTGCNQQYTTKAALKLHLVRDHDEASPFGCEKCKQKFSCESMFKIHQQRLNCRPRKKKTAAKIKATEKSCPHCKFKTAHRFSLNQHINLIHLNIRKTWKCEYCDGLEFTNRVLLNQHLYNSHKASLRCQDCDQRFSNESQLESHKSSLKCNARKATDDDFSETASEVKCNLCNRSYRTKKEWITHYFNHHKFSNICDICNVQLSTYASLKNHKTTIHEKIKAYSCSICAKTFSAKHTLEFHLNTHSGKRMTMYILTKLANLSNNLSKQAKNPSSANFVRSQHQIAAQCQNTKRKFTQFKFCESFLNKFISFLCLTLNKLMLRFMPN